MESYSYLEQKAQEFETAEAKYRADKTQLQDLNIEKGYEEVWHFCF